MHHIAQIYTIFSNKISDGNNPRMPKTGEGLSALPRLLPLEESPPSHFFRASTAADENYMQMNTPSGSSYLSTSTIYVVQEK